MFPNPGILAFAIVAEYEKNGVTFQGYVFPGKYFSEFDDALNVAEKVLPIDGQTILVVPQRVVVGRFGNGLS